VLLVDYYKAELSEIDAFLNQRMRAYYKIDVPDGYFVQQFAFCGAFQPT